MRIKTMDIPARPAHMGIPETNRINAPPNRRTAITYSFISGFPF